MPPSSIISETLTRLAYVIAVTLNNRLRRLQQLTLQPPYNFLLPAALRPAQSAGYLSYSEGNFEVFAPQGQHTAPIGGNMAGGKGPLPHAKFHHIGATIRV